MNLVADSSIAAAQAAVLRGDHGEAERSASTVIDSRSSSNCHLAKAYFLRAIARNSVSRGAEAELDATEALDVISRGGAPSYLVGPLYLELGNAQVLQGREDEAENSYTSGILRSDLNAEDAVTIRVNRARLRARKGAFEGALLDATEAGQRDPYSLDALRVKRLSLQRLGRFEEEIDVLLDMVRRTPRAGDTAEFLNDIAWIRSTCRVASLRNGPQAVVFARLAIERSDAGASPFSRLMMMDTLAAALGESGDFDLALKILEEIVHSPLLSKLGENEGQSIQNEVEEKRRIFLRRGRFEAACDIR